MPSLSIVTSLYKSEQFIRDFYHRSDQTASKLFETVRFIFVNDGSPDNSIDVVKSIIHNDSRVTLIDLSRNFGHHKALMVGLQHTDTDFVWLIDVDLEDQPEWLEEFYQTLKITQSDVVHGTQRSRRGNMFERISGQMYFNFMNLIADTSFQANATTARIMTRQYIKALCDCQDKDPMLAGLWPWIGFKQTSCAIDKPSRGKSSYTLKKKLNLALLSITSFSDIPLRLIAKTGLLTSLFSFVAIIVLCFRAIAFTSPVSGWLSVMVSVWFLGGIILASIGVVGIYIAAIFRETRSRPTTIIKRILSKDDMLISSST